MDPSDGNFEDLFIKDIAGSSYESGCYLRNPANHGLSYSKALVPLKHIDYHLNIMNSLLHVTLTQTYSNPTSKYLSVDYSFPISPKASVY